jgi:hypothetical protein
MIVISEVSRSMLGSYLDECKKNNWTVKHISPSLLENCIMPQDSFSHEMHNRFGLMTHTFLLVIEVNE